MDGGADSGWALVDAAFALGDCSMVVEAAASGVDCGGEGRATSSS